MVWGKGIFRVSTFITSFYLCFLFLIICYGVTFFLVKRKKWACKLSRKMNLETAIYFRDAKKQIVKEIVTMIHLTSA